MPVDVAYIHHYHWKSEDEFRKKIARGCADTPMIRTMDGFDESWQNDTIDSSAWDVFNNMTA
jgi:hypothetical protein